MPAELHRFPEHITLDLPEYRQQIAALEASLAVLDECLAADIGGARRSLYELAMTSLLGKIWPSLGRLGGEE